MLESGEAQIAGLQLKEWPSLLATGRYKQSPEGTVIMHSFPFGGNFWECTNSRTGDVLDVERYISRPWVGDPYENSPGEFDENTESMQRSLKVRRALSMAIDRETINDVLLDGLGTPAQLGGQWLTDPVWIENADKWHYGYQPE